MLWGTVAPPALGVGESKVARTVREAGLEPIVEDSDDAILSKPGVVRGNHYHNVKSEKFLVVEGEALVRLRRVDSDEVVERRVSGGWPPSCGRPADTRCTSTGRPSTVWRAMSR